MPKENFYFDPETLDYKRVRTKKRTVFSYVLLFLTASALFGFFSYVVILQYVKSPKERALIRENENLKIRYEYLNKRMQLAEDVLENIADRDDNIYRVHFESDPVSKEQRISGYTGVNRYKALEGFENSDLIVQSTKRVDKLYKQIEVQSRSLDHVESLLANKEALLKAIPAIQPVQKKDLKRVASGYGMRMHPIHKTFKMHNGIDFTAKTGTPIYAAGDGVVAKAGLGTGFGNVVYIDHGFGYQTRYAHMSKFNTKKGAKVSRGDIIGYVGNTGVSTGPHLHYEVHKNGKPINPVNFFHGDLTPEEYEIMYKRAAAEAPSLD